MNSRWYISILVILLALLGGVANQQQVDMPNQEILLQFTSNEVTSDEAQNAIAIIKKQLLNIGIEDIQVSEQEEGRLKITYYSKIDVVSIKKMLSNDNDLDVGYASNAKHKIPNQPTSHKDSNAYNLDVFEIQNGANGVSDFGGKLAVELKSEHLRFVNPNLFIPFVDLNANESNDKEKVTYNFQRHIAIAIDNSSKKIPEVRAGPLMS